MGCPGKVTSPEHEHRWHDGFGLHCAYPLNGLSDAGYERILDEFCQRAEHRFPSALRPAREGFPASDGHPMMSTQPTTSDSIRESVLATLSDEIRCSVLEDGSNRIGCLTPFEYPDGDAVVVWVRELAGTFEVSDHGEGTSDQEHRSDHERSAVPRSEGGTIHGVIASDGRLGAECDPQALGGLILRVASASAQVAAGIACQGPARRKESEENEFVRLVDETLRESHVPVEREHRSRARRATLTKRPSMCRSPIRSWSRSGATGIRSRASTRSSAT